MIILSVGMPRAGSGWYYNLTHDLALAAGYQDGRRIRQRYHLENILSEVNCNIGALTPRRLLAVLAPSTLGNTFVIKAHAGPTPFANLLIRLGALRPAYIYRDPRDAMLSAYEYGQRALKNGRPNAFSSLTDFDTAVEFMLGYVRIWQAWMGCRQALHSRYEDLLSEYEREASRLVEFLGMDGTQPAIQTVVEKYRPEEARPGQRGLHFNKGKTGRFRQKWNSTQQQVLAEKFGPYLENMGYPL
jgi:hypothetical protein